MVYYFFSLHGLKNIMHMALFSLGIVMFFSYPTLGV